MVQVVLTLALIIFGLGTYFYGAYRLSRYAFRISSGLGWAVLLFPPFTFYYAVFKLEVAGKEFPTALATYGLVLAIGLAVMFSYDLQMVFSGQLDELLEEMDVQLLEERPTFDDDDDLRARDEGREDAAARQSDSAVEEDAQVADEDEADAEEESAEEGGEEDEENEDEASDDQESEEDAE